MNIPDMTVNEAMAIAADPDATGGLGWPTALRVLAQTVKAQRGRLSELEAASAAHVDYANNNMED